MSAKEVVWTYPFFFFVCLGEQLSNVSFRFTHILVENLRTIYNFWLTSIKHFANLSSHQRFSSSRRSKKQDASAMFHPCISGTIVIIPPQALGVQSRTIFQSQDNRIEKNQFSNTDIQSFATISTIRRLCRRKIVRVNYNNALFSVA